MMRLAPVSAHVRDAVDREAKEAARGLVWRGALFRRLSAAPPGGVALVCAPAGSGKSMLVGLWCEAEGLRERTAWVPVERGEPDGQRFWLSVIDALARVAPAVEPVAPTPALRGEVVVERLLSELAALEAPVVLVIDDLHELRSAEALALLERFLASLPPAVRVVLATRDDPRLGLHRLRLAGALSELRGPDLTFSLSETHAVLGAAGITISDAGVAMLHERTEGWAAGVRLAVISLAEHPDPERFVREFSGSERTVAGYLLAEVLDRQPAEVRELLLRTSVLDRVSGALADFLTGGSGSERILHALEDANAFVSAVDVGRSWFRYHQLFAELLQLELRRVSPTTAVPCTGRPPSGTPSTARRSTRCATPRAHGTGPRPRACSPTAMPASSSTGARTRSGSGCASSQPAPRRRTPSWPSCSRACASSTGASTTPRPTSTWRRRGRTPSPRSAGRASSCGLRAPG